MPLLEHAVFGSLARHGESVELARQADGEIGDIDHLLHFALALGQDLAHFERDQRAEIVFEAPQLVADLAHDLAALGGGEHAPAFEHFRCLGHHRLVFFGRREPNARQFAAIGGIERSDGLSARGRDPFSAACPGILRLDAEPL